MRVIILAAGAGSRLGDLGRHQPKCMIELGGRPLLEYQLATLRNFSDDIVVVRGYHAQRISYPGVRYVDNLDYLHTNMVGSLMTARREFEGGCLVSYGDIVYESRLVSAVLLNSDPIAVAVDVDFQEYWNSRLEDPEQDSESLTMGHDGAILELGKPNAPLRSVSGRYVGLLKFSEAGARSFIELHDKIAAEQLGIEKGWYHSRSFRQAFMTDMLQALIDSGQLVRAVGVRRGWVETDTEADVLRYEEWIRTGTMRRFCTVFYETSLGGQDQSR